MIGSKIESTIASVGGLFSFMPATNPKLKGLPKTNPKLLVPSSHKLGVILMVVKRQIAVNYFTVFFICLNHYSVAYDCSMAKKRRAEEQASGVPVNKRKSLLMKPRHYSPNMNSQEGLDTRMEAEDDIGLLGTNAHPTTGSKEGPKVYICSQAPKTQS